MMDSGHTKHRGSRYYRNTVLFLAVLTGVLFLTLSPSRGMAEVFPEGSFDRRQVDYTVSGATVNGYHDFRDPGTMAYNREMTGRLTDAGTLSVNGTFHMDGSFAGVARAQVTIGDRSEFFERMFVQPTASIPFSVSLPVPAGTEIATINVSLHCLYIDAHDELLSVSGTFVSEQVPEGIDERPDLAGGPRDNPNTKFLPRRCEPQGLPGYTVNTALLNLVVGDLDFGCEGLGHALGLRRVYSMRPYVYGMFGNGWSFAYDSQIAAYLPASGGVKIKLGSGQIVRYRVESIAPGPPGQILVRYERTTPGLGQDLSATLDEVTGVGTYLLTDKQEKRTHTYSYMGYEEGYHMYHLETISDRNGNAIHLAYDARNRLSVLTDASGRRTTFTYDENDYCVRMETFDGNAATFAYSSNGKMIRSVDLAGNVSDYVYDDRGYITSMTVVGKTTTFGYTLKPDENRYLSSVTEPDGKVRRYVLNPDGSTQVTEPGGGTLVFSHLSGRTASITDPLGQTYQTAYDDRYLPVRRIDPLGRTTTLAYDAEGNLLCFTDAAGDATRLSYDARGNLTGVTNPLGGTTTFRYDERDNLIDVTSPLGRKTGFTRDNRGQVTEVIGPDGARYGLSHDPYGNLVQIVNPLGQSVSVGFDQAGLNPETVIDPLGNTTGFDFDENRRLIAVTRPDGVSERLRWDCCALSAIEDGGGRVTAFERDAVHRLTRVLDPSGGAWAFAYDPDGMLAASTDPLGRSVGIAYDPAHRPIALVDPLNGRISLARDVVGNPTRLSDERENSTAFSWDDRDRLRDVTDPLGVTTVGYTYDALGRIVGIANARGDRITLGYDADGRLVSKAYNDAQVAVYAWSDGSALSAVTDASGTKAFTYDAAGRVTGIAYPGGKTAAFGYDGNGNLEGITYPDGSRATYTYDALNRATGVQFSGNTVSLSYDTVGNLVGETRSNGVMSVYTWDASRRLTRIRHEQGGTAIVDLTYTRNQAGAVTGESGTWPLTPALLPGSTRADYDAVNAILTENGDAFTHDLDGNRTAVSGSRAFSAVYDPENRPVSITRSGTTTSTTYDGLGNRVRASAGAFNRTFFHDAGGRLLSEADSAGNLVHYIYAGGRLVASGSPDKGYVFHQHNQIGSALALTDASGRVVAAFAYDPYGRILGRTGTVVTPFTYVGAYGVMDEGDGLYFMRNRYYDAHTGRFLHRDPIGFKGGQTNLYAYVGGDPINRVDPSGLSDFVATEWGYEVKNAEGTWDIPSGCPPHMADAASDEEIEAALVAGVLVSTAPFAAAALADAAYAAAVRVSAWALCHPLATGTGTGIALYSGRSPTGCNPGLGMARAAQAAGEGIRLLENTLGGRFLNLINERIVTVPTPVWDAASALFVATSRGPVHVYLRGMVNPNSVWNRVERPILEWLGRTVTYH